MNAITRAIAANPTIKPNRVKEIVKPRKTNSYFEAREQRNVIAIAKYMARNTKKYPHLDRLHSSLNGENRKTVEQRARAKDQGLLAGVPDLFLPVPWGKYCGLYIELKWGDNKPSVAQEKFIRESIMLGYKAVVCWSSQEAIAVIEDYYREV